MTEKENGISIETPDTLLSIEKDNKEVLRLEANGSIIWQSPKGEVIIEDKKLLHIAFMGCIINLTNMEYDYSVLDKEVYEQYKKFLDTYEINVNGNVGLSEIPKNKIDLSNDTDKKTNWNTVGLNI